MTRALRVLTIGGLLLAACGGSDDQAGTLTVSEVASATDDAATFRFSGELQIERAGAPVAITGEQDEHGRARLALGEVGRPGASESIVVGRRAYLRVPRWAGAQRGGWCTTETSEYEDGPQVAALDTLSKLEQDGRSLDRLGEERVRDTDTVRYAVEGPGAPTEIWVDAEDRLRRLAWTDDEQTGTMELYDFGVPIEIQLPENAPPCGPPEGGGQDCVIDFSDPDLPACVDPRDPGAEP